MDEATIKLAVELADSPEDVSAKLEELAAFGSREDRIAAMAARD